jgi:hypothetical protein
MTWQKKPEEANKRQRCSSNFQNLFFATNFDIFFHPTVLILSIQSHSQRWDKLIGAIFSWWLKVVFYDQVLNVNGLSNIFTLFLGKKSHQKFQICAKDFFLYFIIQIVLAFVSFRIFHSGCQLSEEDLRKIQLKCNRKERKGHLT